MKLYNVVIDEKTGNVTINTELTPQDMEIMLSVGFLTLVQQGMMVKSLSKYFQQQLEENPEIEKSVADVNDILDGKE